MQPLDKHTLFSLFEAGDEEVYKEHGVESVLNNPYVLINMVIRGVENYHLMDLMYSRHHKDEYEAIKSSLKYKYYVRLYKYLERINLNEIGDEFKVGTSFDFDSAWDCLNELLYYFEKLEDYKKCAIVKQFTDLINSYNVKYTEA